MDEYRSVSELVDPRPLNEGRSAYQGMALLPVSYECDWMMANTGLLRLVGEEMFVISCEAGFSC